MMKQFQLQFYKILTMSLRRNQLKKMSLDQIMELLSKETDPENIKTINIYVSEKNQALIDKKTLLLEHLEATRKKVQKNVRALNGRVKDRIQKKQTLVMNKDSRPVSENITDLMDLFAYLQKQGTIIDRNSADIQHIASETSSRNNSLRQPLGVTPNYDELDRQYAQLNKQCQEQAVIRDGLLKDRNDRRVTYANIKKEIEECRKEYEIVESAIRNKERELIQISTYFQSRSQEDNQALVDLPQQAINYEAELLEAQNKLNQCQTTLQDRKVRDIEATSS